MVTAEEVRARISQQRQQIESQRQKIEKAKLKPLTTADVRKQTQTSLERRKLKVTGLVSAKEKARERLKPFELELTGAEQQLAEYDLQQQDIAEAKRIADGSSDPTIQNRLLDSASPRVKKLAQNLIAHDKAIKSDMERSALLMDVGITPKNFTEDFDLSSLPEKDLIKLEAAGYVKFAAETQTDLAKKDLGEFQFASKVDTRNIDFSKDDVSPRFGSRSNQMDLDKDSFIEKTAKDAINLGGDILQGAGGFIGKVATKVGIPYTITILPGVKKNIPTPTLSNVGSGIKKTWDFGWKQSSNLLTGDQKLSLDLPKEYVTTKETKFGTTSGTIPTTPTQIDLKTDFTGPQKFEEDTSLIISPKGTKTSSLWTDLPGAIKGGAEGALFVAAPIITSTVLTASAAGEKEESLKKFDEEIKTNRDKAYNQQILLPLGEGERHPTKEEFNTEYNKFSADQRLNLEKSGNVNIAIPAIFGASFIAGKAFRYIKPKKISTSLGKMSEREVKEFLLNKKFSEESISEMTKKINKIEQQRADTGYSFTKGKGREGEFTNLKELKIGKDDISNINIIKIRKVNDITQVIEKGTTLQPGKGPLKKIQLYDSNLKPTVTKELPELKANKFIGEVPSSTSFSTTLSRGEKGVDLQITDSYNLGAGGKKVDKVLQVVKTPKDSQYSELFVLPKGRTSARNLPTKTGIPVEVTNPNAFNLGERIIVKSTLLSEVEEGGKIIRKIGSEFRKVSLDKSLPKRGIREEFLPRPDVVKTPEALTQSFERGIKVEEQISIQTLERSGKTKPLSTIGRDGFSVGDGELTLINTETTSIKNLPTIKLRADFSGAKPQPKPSKPFTPTEGGDLGGQVQLLKPVKPLPVLQITPKIKPPTIPRPKPTSQLPTQPVGLPRYVGGAGLDSFQITMGQGFIPEIEVSSTLPPSTISGRNKFTGFVKEVPTSGERTFITDTSATKLDSRVTVDIGLDKDLDKDKIILGSGSSSIPRQTSIPTSTLKVETAQIQAITPIQAQQSVIKTVQALRTAQKLKTPTRSQRQRSRTTKFIPRLKGDEVKGRTHKKLKELKGTLVNVRVGMEKGRTKVVKKGMTPFRALKFAQKYVDKNIEASFRIIPTGKKSKKKDIKSSNVSKKFRPSKRNALFVVEKKKYRLDSPTEKKQIKQRKRRK